mmetsp:Transcript_57462/g.134731  ORF Transcript_57462/g.134731 Transcript_57462/m.134731 type:complete len:176 (+) Transcript_57462:119-646(+)
MAELPSHSESDLDVGSLLEIVRMVSSDISSHLEVSSGPGSQPAVLSEWPTPSSDSQSRFDLMGMIVGLEKALKIQEGQYGPDHAEVATTLFDLGKAYGDLFEASGSRVTDCLEASRDHLERALRIKEAHYGADHAEVLITLRNLGTAYGKLGDASKSRDYLERAVKIASKMRTGH